MANCKICNKDLNSQIFNSETFLHNCGAHYVCMLEYMATTGFQSVQGGWKCQCELYVSYDVLQEVSEKHEETFAANIYRVQKQLENATKSYEQDGLTSTMRRVLAHRREYRNTFYETDAISTLYKEIFRQYHNSPDR